jgi:hypothetical protein
MIGLTNYKPSQKTPTKKSSFKKPFKKLLGLGALLALLAQNSFAQSEQIFYRPLYGDTLFDLYYALKVTDKVSKRNYIEEIARANGFSTNYNPNLIYAGAPLYLPASLKEACLKLGSINANGEFVFYKQFEPYRRTGRQLFHKNRMRLYDPSDAPSHDGSASATEQAPVMNRPPKYLHYGLGQGDYVGYHTGQVLLGTEYMVIGATDGSSNTRGYIISSASPAFDVKLGQVWNKKFETSESFHLSHLTFENPPSRVIDNKTQNVIQFTVEGSYRVYKQLKLGLSVEIGDELYYASDTFTDITLQKQIIPKYNLFASLLALNSKPLSLELKGGYTLLAESPFNNYETTFGQGYFGQAEVGHEFKNFTIVFNVRYGTYHYKKSTVTYDVTELGFYLGVRGFLGHNQ